MKQDAQNSKTSVRDLISEAKSGLSVAQLVRVPLDHAMQEKIGYHRHKKQNNNAELDRNYLMDFVIPDEYKVTANNGRFLLFDSLVCCYYQLIRYTKIFSIFKTGAGNERERSPSRSPTRRQQIKVNENERIIIFSSPEALQLALRKHSNQHSAHKNWSMDGTFASCPKVFKVTKSGQIFVIGTIIRNRTIPCVYALISRQNKPTFTILFEQLRKVKYFCLVLFCFDNLYFF